MKSSEIRMRAIILVAGAALALTACGKNGQADTATNAGENLTAESIVYNDVTAIDAVTGDAANMAADMDVNFPNELDNGLGNAAAPSGSASRPPARTRAVTQTPAGNETTASESANATTE
jgi:hypothetical protein